MPETVKEKEQKGENKTAEERLALCMQMSQKEVQKKVGNEEVTLKTQGVWNETEMVPVLEWVDDREDSVL